MCSNCVLRCLWKYELVVQWDQSLLQNFKVLKSIFRNKARVVWLNLDGKEHERAALVNYDVLLDDTLKFSNGHYTPYQLPYIMFSLLSRSNHRLRSYVVGTIHWRHLLKERWSLTIGRTSPSLVILESELYPSWLLSEHINFSWVHTKMADATPA